MPLRIGRVGDATGTKYTVTVERDEDGVFVAVCPALHAVSHGATQDEAMSNIREAVEMTLRSMREEGETIPPDIAVATLDVA